MPDIAKKMRVRKRAEIKACAKEARVIASIDWQDYQFARQQSYLCHLAEEIKRHLFDGFDHCYTPQFRAGINAQLDYVRSLLQTIEQSRAHLKQLKEQAQAGEF